MFLYEMEFFLVSSFFLYLLILFCFLSSYALEQNLTHMFLFFIHFLWKHIQVVRILAWDTVNHLVYYLGTTDKKPGQQHLYIVKDPVNEDPRR
jgi:hypothetical protein